VDTAIASPIYRPAAPEEAVVISRIVLLRSLRPQPVLWLAVALAGCGGAPSPDPGANRVAAPYPDSASGASIRRYLAERFLYETWYGSVRNVTAKSSTATISVDLPEDASGEADARRVCSAVLSSHRVLRVVVRYRAPAPVVCGERSTDSDAAQPPLALSKLGDVL
jgi:hypothetical protein